MDRLAAKPPRSVDGLHEQLRRAATDLVMSPTEAEFSRHAARIERLVIKVGNRLFDQPEQQASAA